MKMKKMYLPLFYSLLMGHVAQGFTSRMLDEGKEAQESNHIDIDSRILEANKDSNNTLLEGDIALPKRRNAMKCPGGYCKWRKSSNGLVEVPYIVSDYYYKSEKDIILNAMSTFHQKTCVRFIPHTGQSDYLSIENQMGCWSTVGKEGGLQVVSLSVNGCLERGVIQHELLHSLGFYHEHTRSDRDQYVRINWENISTANAVNFNKMDTNNLNTPYDYSSIMHYGRSVFSKVNGADSITPIPNRNVQIGQRDAMSTIDILRVNKLYECNI